MSKIPVVAYLRMSSDDQAESIERQRTEINNYAERRNYEIVREYVDSGKSASSTIDLNKRTEFLQLLADSTNSTWKIVVCYNVSRFGRLDSIDGAFAKKALRENGVSLDTVREGEFDWATAGGRFKDMALSEAAHQYAQTIANDSMSGRLRALLQRKEYPNGMIPYGYDVLFTDGQTKIEKKT